jgi:hypothetical protein
MATFTYESLKNKFLNPTVKGNLDLLDDGGIIKIGADDDLQLTHSGSAGTITNDPGNLTLDVAGDIILDADGGDVTFKDDGTEFGNISNSSSNLLIQSSVQDKDIIFKGNDGGSTVTALTLDMSAAGASTFNSGATFGGAITSNSGVVVDEMTLDGDTLTATDDFTIDAAADIILDADGADIRFKDNGTTIGEISATNSDFNISSSVQDKDIVFKGNDGGSTITALTLDMSADGAATFKNDVTAFSDERLKTDIKTIDNALSKVCDMRGVYFNRDGAAGTGVIAQELQNVLPEVVHDKQEYLSVAYGNMVGVLIEAIKELKKEVETLKESK